MSRRTITLTDRPPVTISEEAWPLIASASYHDYDGQYDFQSFRHWRGFIGVRQSFRHWRGFIGVRQHADGRAIVYATTSAEGCGSSSVSHEYSRKGGELLTIATPADIINAIRRVHDSLTHEYSHERWGNLAAECIADMPADVLD
jgi:hypothetical protein